MLLIPAVVFFMATAGCGKKNIDDDDGDVVVSKPPKGGKKPKERTAIKAPLDGTIKGKVILEGEVPMPEFITAMNGHNDKAHCLMGDESEKVTQTWRVDKSTKGVANAVVYLKIPANNYFELTETARTPTKKVEKLHQPHCAFIPHVVALFPKYYDGSRKDMKPTGQELEVLNDAAMPHNTKIVGDPLKNPDFDTGSMPPNSKKLLVLTPQSNPLSASCAFHTWMSAKIWAFDHPFFAVTDDKGNFEIKNVPTGAEVTLVGWHEGKGNFTEQQKTFKKGDNSVELTIAR